MKALLDLLRDLMLFRRGPQDLPYSTSLLGAASVIAFALDAFVASRFQQVGDAAPRVAFSLAALLALPWIALRLADKQPRYAQTALALVATSVMFTILTVPVLIGVGPLPQDPKDLTATQALLGWFSLLLVGWQLAVRGHILRHALDLPMRLGVLVAVVFFAVELLLALLLFGRSASA
jgi:hypothetical protein